MSVPKLTDDQADEAARMYRRGKLAREIAATFQVNENVILYALKQRGVTTRRRKAGS